MFVVYVLVLNNVNKQYPMLCEAVVVLLIWVYLVQLSWPEWAGVYHEIT